VPFTTCFVIRSFGDKDTERIWHEEYVKSVDRTVQRATVSGRAE